MTTSANTTRHRRYTGPTPAMTHFVTAPLAIGKWGYWILGGVIGLLIDIVIVYC